MGQPMLDRHASCFLILVQCIELILRSSKFAIDLEVLQQSIGSHLKAFQDLYGAQAMTPTFHYNLHFPPSFADLDGFQIVLLWNESIKYQSASRATCARAMPAMRDLLYERSPTCTFLLWPMGLSMLLNLQA